MLVSILIHAQLPCIDSISFKIQHLPEPEKAQIQNFCNWVENNPESSTRSTPDSPIMGVIKGSGDVATQKVSTFGDSKEDAPGAEKSAPSSASTEKPSPSTSAAAAGEARGSGSSGTRIIPFQSLPSSVQEELGKELFDDPLLTPGNMKKLQDSMKWIYKFVQVSLISSQSVLASSCLQFDKLAVFLQDVANRSFLKSHALYKTLDNRKLLSQKDAEIAKRIDQALAMRNQLYETNRKHTRETYELK